MKAPSSRLFWQTFLGLSALLALPAFYETILQADKLQISLLHSKWVVLLAAFLFNIFGALILFRAIQTGRLDRLIESLDSTTQDRWLRAAGTLGVVVAVAAFWFLRLSILARFLPRIFPALWFFIWFSLLGAAAFRLASRRSWAASFAALVVLQGVLFVLYGRLRLVSADPFSLGYSEGGRYYYASLVFAKSVYGISVKLSSILPSRYLLQAVPFLAEGLPIWVHRLWQAMLWIGLTAASAYLLVRRLGLKQRGLMLLMTGWLIMYFFEGPVYYHLQLCVIIILLGYSGKHPARSLMAVLAASAWAGISRINWYPVPALLAITLYFLETPLSQFEHWGSYLRRPALWGILGLLVAFVPQRLYDLWLSTDETTQLLGSVQTSSLLFYRLLPNPSFAPGILLGIVIVSLPLWIYLYIVLRKHIGHLHPLRLLGLGAITLALFAGGLLVSTKIGGGAELHNMDAYMIALGIISAYFLAGRVRAEDGKMIMGPAAPWPAVLGALILPVAFSLQQVVPTGYERAGTARDLQTLQEIASQATSGGGEVLFIAERQLLTFGLVRGVPLVPDYEVATLMEMAMSGNMGYLDRFYADLRSHRFAVIIARRQSTALQEQGEESFAEENNVWSELIAKPLLCYYEPVTSLSFANVQVFEPRPQTPVDCR